ncbi:membrane protein insertion efficiency factor YidD [Candidatus Neomarinimicrobiota bacterium]
MSNKLKYFWHFPDIVVRKLLTGVFLLYRLLLSPMLGNRCRFSPSCSAYAIESLSKKTFPVAIILIIKRVSKCHPFHEGGYDPVK